MTAEQRQAFWIRVLLLACGLLGVLAGAQFRALGIARHDLQALRAEREQAKMGVNAAWARQAADEFASAIRVLQDVATAPDGLNRPEGLCAGGRPDADAIATWVLGVFVPARAAGQPVAAAARQMEEAVRRGRAGSAQRPPGPGPS